MRDRLRILSSLLAILFLLAACRPVAPAPTDASSEAEWLHVVVSLSPVANIFDNIGPIQPNDTAQPSAQEIAAIIDQVRDEGVPDSEKGT